MDFKAARADEFGEKVAVGNSGMGVVGKLPGQGQDSFGLVEIELSYRLWHGGSKKEAGRKNRPAFPSLFGFGGRVRDGWSIPRVAVARKRNRYMLWF